MRKLRSWVIYLLASIGFFYLTGLNYLLIQNDYGLMFELIAMPFINISYYVYIDTLFNIRFGK